MKAALVAVGVKNDPSKTTITLAVGDDVILGASTKVNLVTVAAEISCFDVPCVCHRCIIHAQ